MAEATQPRVDPQTCARTFVSRVARELAADEARARELRARAADVARWLRQRGATDVWLFGSLAWGEPHGASDVDLLVGGIPDAAWPELAREVERRLSGARVDLVRVEEADEALVDRVSAEGIRLG